MEAEHVDSEDNKFQREELPRGPLVIPNPQA